MKRMRLTLRFPKILYWEGGSHGGEDAKNMYELALVSGTNYELKPQIVLYLFLLSVSSPLDTSSQCQIHFCITLRST